MPYTTSTPLLSIAVAVGAGIRDPLMESLMPHCVYPAALAGRKLLDDTGARKASAAEVEVKSLPSIRDARGDPIAEGQIQIRVHLPPPYQRLQHTSLCGSNRAAKASGSGVGLPPEFPAGSQCGHCVGVCIAGFHRRLSLLTVYREVAICAANFTASAHWSVFEAWRRQYPSSGPSRSGPELTENPLGLASRGKWALAAEIVTRTWGNAGQQRPPCPRGFGFMNVRRSVLYAGILRSRSRGRFQDVTSTCARALCRFHISVHMGQKHCYLLSTSHDQWKELFWAASTFSSGVAKNAVAFSARPRVQKGSQTEQQGNRFGGVTCRTTRFVAHTSSVGPCLINDT